MDENQKNSIINFDKETKSLVSYATSKGNLPKWHIDDCWYKTDAFGYENLSECLISDLLKYSNIYNYVEYKMIKGIYNSELKSFSKSKNFLDENENLLTFYRLYFLETGNELSKEIYNYNEVKDRISFVVDFIANTYHLNQVGKIIASILELDMFFLNEDRHFNNFALIRDIKEDTFSFAPLFDNGLSLLSDTNEYNMSVDVYKNMDKVNSKPFSNSFEEQCECAESLYGSVLKFTFTKNDVLREIEKYRAFYSNEIIERVITIIFEQMRKYHYLFEDDVKTKIAL